MSANGEILSEGEVTRIRQLRTTGELVDYDAGSTSSGFSYEGTSLDPARRIEAICAIIGVEVESWPKGLKYLSINESSLKGADLNPRRRSLAKAGIPLGDFVVRTAFSSLTIEGGGDGDYNNAVVIVRATDGTQVKIIAEGDWWDSSFDAEVSRSDDIGFEIRYRISI